jgi:gas vesicle protein
LEKIQKRIKAMYGNCRQKDFFWGALVGGTVAILSTLLFTTKKGKQIQRQISDKYDEIENSVKDAWADSKEKLEESAEQVGKKLAHKAKHEDHHKDSK